MKLTVVGTGHVGLVAGLCFAEIGHDVVCVDNDENKIAGLRRRELPFFEPHLDELLERNVRAGRVRFTADVGEGVDHGGVLFLCVGTPPLPGGDPDLSAVERVGRDIAARSSSDKLVVEKSTVPVRTGEWVDKTLRRYARQGVSFEVASNPEFLAEGSAVLDFLCPDRIVLGVESEQARAVLREIYKPVVKQTFGWNLSTLPRPGRGEVPLIVTNRNSAEMIKHASNSFLAMKISYINAVANLCDRVGAEVEKVAEGMGLDHRIGPKFLQAGIGFGGFCFPKDLQAFIRMAEEHGYDFQLLREVERINRSQIEVFLAKLREALWIIKDKTIAAWGLSFKPHTDDLRFSPAIAVVQRLMAESVHMRAYDPQAAEEARKALPDLKLCSSPLDAAEGADAVVLLTDWPEFRDVDLTKLRQAMARPLILDGRNLLDPAAVRQAGFEYYSMGRPSADVPDAIQTHPAGEVAPSSPQIHSSTAAASQKSSG